MMFIKQARTPTLILHGQQDTRVPIGQAQELYMGLKKNGVPVTLVFYPREGHGLMEPRHGLDKMKREYAFFSKHVLGIEVKDQPDLVYRTEEAKFDAVVKKVQEMLAAGRPILIGTRTVDASKKVSAKLTAVGVKHRVLNAEQNEGEAEVVAEAGWVVWG